MKLRLVRAILSAIICPWLNFGLPPRCPQVVWCIWGEIEPFSATLAQDGLAECDQLRKNPLKYSAVAGNWARVTGRTDSELSHWAITTDVRVIGTGNYVRSSFSQWVLSMSNTLTQDRLVNPFIVKSRNGWPSKHLLLSHPWQWQLEECTFSKSS